MPPPISRAARLRAELDRLSDVVGTLGFALPSPHQEERHRRREALVRTIDSYLVPRLGSPDAPLLVVVAGPTGSGKSTLVNSLAGSMVSTPGALRPTTREPVVWAHPRHADAFSRIGGIECRVVAEAHPLLTDVALVDTPDIDSYVADHRRITVELLRHADVVVFVTSAQRYADAVPWEVLGEADDRGSVLVAVLNRLGRRSSGAVSDYAALLRTRGIDPGPIRTIQEQRVRGEAGILPSRAVGHVRDRLTELAGDRQAVLAAVTARAVDHVLVSAEWIATAVEQQERERERLAGVVAEVYGSGLAEVEAELGRGTLIRTEVVERWSERVGTGAVARWMKGSASALQATVDRLSGRPAAVVEDVQHEARRVLVDAVRTRLDRSARAVAAAWSVEEGARDLITDDLRRTGEDTVAEIEAAVEVWLAGLTRLVEEEAPTRFRAARVASTGVNAAAVATILALFAATGGISGAEAGVAAGAAAAQQGLLEHILGRAAAGSLTGAARRSLGTAIRRMFEVEAARFERVLGLAADPVAQAGSVRAVASVVAAESETFHAR